MTGIACNDMIDANLRNMVKIIILDIHASAKVAFCTRLCCFWFTAVFIEEFIYVI